MNGSARPAALVTGASSGIGLAFARLLAEQGHDLIVVARRKERLDTLGMDLHARHGVTVTPLKADLTTDAGIEASERACATAGARLKLVVNDAGFGGYAPFAELTTQQIEALIAIHVRAVARLTHAAVRVMLAHDGGHVINVASLLFMSGSIPPNPLPARATYVGAKSFITNFSRTLAKELEKTNVRIHALLPGVVESEFHGGHKLEGEMAAEDVAKAALTAMRLGETVCMPSVHDPSLFDTFVQAETAIFRNARNAEPAERYRG